MAKKSVIYRNIKRERLVARYASKRAELKKILADPKTSEEEFYDAQAKLDKLISSAGVSQQIFNGRHVYSVWSFQNQL